MALTSVPTIERNDGVVRSCELLAAGSAAHPPPPASFTRSRKGRSRQHQATNRLGALLGRADHVLALLDDLRIPLTNKPGLARPSLGTRSARDFRHFSPRCWRHRFVPHPQFSCDDAQARTSHAHPFLVAWEPE
jgi:hypothetical protein